MVTLDTKSRLIQHEYEEDCEEVAEHSDQSKPGDHSGQLSDTSGWVQVSKHKMK